MKNLLLLIVAPILLTGCASNAPQPDPVTLTVFAAASLTDACNEIGTAFEKAHPGVDVVFNFGSSNGVRTQIEAGAQADVFASANLAEMETLIESGLVQEDSPRIFLTNHLVVVIPASNPADIISLQDLTRPGLKMILAAEEVPAGRYARQALEKMNAAYGGEFEDKVLANVVSNEQNVRQVLAKVKLAEADAGIVYASDAVAAPDLTVIEIPPEFNVGAEYPIAILKNAPNPELAQGFVEYVLSPDGQAVLQKWGFAPKEATP